MDPWSQSITVNAAEDGRVNSQQQRCITKTDGDQRSKRRIARARVEHLSSSPRTERKSGITPEVDERIECSAACDVILPRQTLKRLAVEKFRGSSSATNTNATDQEQRQAGGTTSKKEESISIYCSTVVIDYRYIDSPCSSNTV